MRRAALISAAALVVIALGPVAAQAGTFTVSYSSSSGLLIQGGPFDDQASVQRSPASTFAVFTSIGTVATAGAGCTGQGENAVRCEITGNTVITANLGDGRDRLIATAPNDAFVHGEGGDDELRGGFGFDAIDGGPGNDTVSGAGGNDLLEGGDGDDRLEGDGGGTDTIRGGNGKDTLVAAATPNADLDQNGQPVGSADLFDGGPDRDTADFSARTAAVKLNTDYGDPNFAQGTDGQDGEGDDLENVETIIGGSGDDVLRVAASPSTAAPSMSVRLRGNAGADGMRIGPGILGDVDGGVGADTFILLGRSHAVAARDGEHDTFTCGFNTELITADLRDPPFGNSCGPVNIGAVREGPNVVVRSKRVTVDEDGSLSARLRCPRVLKRDCAGRLVARLDRSGRDFGRGARYSIDPGDSETVELTLPAGQRDAARRRGARVRLQSVEKGDHGPKTTIVSLPARAGP
jgi:RTX calcium-binding nonapeptide repeat (4 copies)